MSGQRHITAIALLVRDYDEAIAWYRDALDFVLLEDTALGGGKRWVRIAPRCGTGFSLRQQQG
ncbi:MAG TPA: VOC family protein, partial [Xanthomonadaceae bacterium]|nr:VOC family protein [Xanthomonadaceae bacterium]